MAEERLKIAVFIDFDNIQIGVKETLEKDFDVSIVLEALKERGEVVSKVAYGDWPRASEYSREMTQHAIHMVQRSVTPRGDKNGADINLALDALEMAFTRNHINTFVIVGGDSDFIALVEKLKQYDKRVFVVGGRQFTSGILQRNCHEFISYENLLKTSSGDSASPRASARTGARPTAESRALAGAMPNIQRALQILAEREVAPQLGLLKSTLLQLDATFSERDYGAGSFLEFIQKLERRGWWKCARLTAATWSRRLKMLFRRWRLLRHQNRLPNPRQLRQTWWRRNRLKALRKRPAMNRRRWRRSWRMYRRLTPCRFCAARWGRLPTRALNVLCT